MTNDMSRALARQEAELNDAAIAIIRDIAGGAREDRPSGFREAACRDLAVQLADVIEYRKEVETIRLIHLAALDRSREYLEARYPHLDLPELDYPGPAPQEKGIESALVKMTGMPDVKLNEEEALDEPTNPAPDGLTPL